MTLRTVRLKARPHGFVKNEDFEFRDEPLPEPGPGELRVKVQFISLDPAMRGWMNDFPSYVPPVGLGEVMRAYAAGIVDASNHPDFDEGDAVTGLFGVATHAISDGTHVVKVDTGRAPLERWIGGLGMPGLTAYLGLDEIGQPKRGETVVVSAASGAVGSIVGQLAKIAGCRAVGIAGGTRKCAYLREELGFDAAVDYKAGGLTDALQEACPEGIDIYWENVGGEVSDAVFPLMNDFGRIPLCGLIAGYNATEVPVGQRNLWLALPKRLRYQGFIVFDYAARYREAVTALAKWYAEGRLVIREDVREGGVHAFPEVLNELFTGGNLGKLVLRV